jgi:hypothetical protein
MIDYVFENPHHLHKMVVHVGVRSISELFPLFLAYESVHYEERKTDYCDLKLEIIDEIINLISQTADPEVIIDFN